MIRKTAIKREVIFCKMRVREDFNRLELVNKVYKEASLCNSSQNRTKQ